MHSTSREITKSWVCLLWLSVILVGCQFSQFEPAEFTPYTKVSPTIGPTITVTSLPNYLGVVVPGPGETYTIMEYQSLAPSLGWNATVPSVCFSITPFRFLEPGDAPTAEKWLAQVHLIVDDRIITEYHSLLKTNSEGSQLIDPETGETIWKEPAGSPLRSCYAAPLEIGQHIATLVVEKTSGEQETCTWSFTITE